MKLEHIEIITNNIHNTVSFYQDILCLPIIEKEDNSITVQAGNSVLKFVENPLFNSVYHFAFNIPENKLYEAIEWCKNKVDVLTITEQNVVSNFETWNANAIYFYDNNGNLLEFIARHDLDNVQNEKFNSKSILNISEIGIVNENPLELGNQLETEYGLNFFSKNPNSEVFSAIGDDEGLLIIVKPGRNWFPTQIPSESNRTLIRVQNKGNIHDLQF